MAYYGQRTLLYKIPFSDWNEDEYENAYKQSKEEDTDPPPENNPSSGMMGIKVHFLEDIELGDPDGKALSFTYGTALNLHHSDYRIGRILGAGYHWRSDFPKIAKGKDSVISMENNTFLSALKIAYQEEGFSYANRLIDPLRDSEKPFSREILNDLNQLAPIYGKMTYSDIVFFDKWIDKKYPDSKGMKIGEITLETLTEHKNKIIEFFSTKLSTLAENKWLQDFAAEKYGQADRIAKLEYLKDRINNIPEELINELLEETGFQMGDTMWSLLKGFAINRGDYIATGVQVAEDEVNRLLSIDEKFREKGFSIREVFDFIHVFQEIAIGKAFHMLDESRIVLYEEKERYGSADEVQELYDFIHLEYAPSFKETDKIRAKATKKILAENEEIPIRQFENFVSLPLSPWANNHGSISRTYKYLTSVKNDEKKLAEYISLITPNTLILTFAAIKAYNYQLERDLDYVYPERRKPGAPKYKDKKIEDWYDEVLNSDERFLEADLMDMETVTKIGTEGAAQFPILFDISIDFRKYLLYDRKRFGIEIKKLIDVKIDNNEKVTKDLKRDPAVAWKFNLLIENIKEEYGISDNSSSGKAIQDLYNDEEKQRFWEGIGMGIIGIGLGIAGFFTAGTTWAGLAFAGAGAVLSYHGLSQSIKEYEFTDAARNTSLDAAMELSNREPSVLPIVLGVVGLILDLGTVMKVLSKVEVQVLSHSFRELSTSVPQSQEFRSSLKKIYDTLGKNRLKGNPDFETFLTNVTKIVEENKAFKAFDEDLLKIFKNAGFEDTVAKEFVEGLPGLGLKRIYELDQEIARRIIKGFAGNKKALYQLTVESAFNKQFAESLTAIGSKIRSKDLFEKTLSYLTNNRRTGLSTLEETLRHINAGKIIDEKLVSEIITNPKLRTTLRNMDNPEDLNGLWKQFENDKPHSSFSEYAASKANFRKNQKISSRYPDFSKLTTREKNLTLIGDTEPHLADLLKNGKLLPDNPQLKKAVTELLDKELIGNTSVLSSARGKIISKLNEVIGSNIRNVDEFKEVMKLIEQPASRGSIGEYYAFSKKLLGASESQISRHLSIDVSKLGLKNPQKFNPDELIFNKQSGKFGEIKSGYPTGGVDLDQVDNYVTIFQNRFKPEYADMFKQLGVEPQNFKGVEYLVLPGKAGDETFKAAQGVYNAILGRKGAEDLLKRSDIMIKYLDTDNIVKIYKP